MSGAARETLLQAIGHPVPEFTLPDLAGVSRSLGSFLAGKRGGVVVFWSGVCSHCVRYDDFLNRFATRHPDLALVGVAARQDESLEQVRSVVAERRIAFPILYDADRSVAHRWFVQQTPRMFLLDPDLRLLYRGAIDNFRYPADPEYQADLEPAIEAFLAGRPIARPETASFGCAIESVSYILPKLL